MHCIGRFCWGKRHSNRHRFYFFYRPSYYLDEHFQRTFRFYLRVGFDHYIALRRKGTKSNGKKD